MTITEIVKELESELASRNKEGEPPIELHPIAKERLFAAAQKFDAKLGFAKLLQTAVGIDPEDDGLDSIVLGKVNGWKALMKNGAERIRELVTVVKATADHHDMSDSRISSMDAAADALFKHGTS